jgi:hypothetical protein
MLRKIKGHKRIKQMESEGYYMSVFFPCFLVELTVD